MKTDCESVGRLLSLTLDGELAPELRGEVEAHLAACAPCREALDAWSRIGLASMDLLRQAIPAAPLREAPARKARRPRALRGPLRTRPLVPVLIAAGALVGVSLLVAYAFLGGAPIRPAETAVSPLKPSPAPEPPPAPRPLPAPVPAPDPPKPPPDPEPPRKPPEPTPAPVPPVKPDPAPAPPPPAPPRPPAPLPEKPAPPPPVPPKESRIVVADLERLWGDVFVTTPSGRAPAKEGHKLLSGSKIETAAGSGRVLLKYLDSTWVYLGAGTELTVLQGGKRFEVVRGEVTADVARQPKDQPVIFATKNAEARVVGTRLTLVAGDEATRLEVMEGRVRLSRAEDNAFVEVGRDHYALVGKGLALAARPIPYGPNLLGNAGFEAGAQGWNSSNRAAAPVVRAPVRSGQRAQQVGPANPEIDAYQDASVTPGTAYRATAWMRCSGVPDDAGARVFVQWLDAAGGLVRDADNLGLFKGTQDWAFVHGRFTAPAGAARARVYLHVGGGGTGWFDDVYFGHIR